MDETLTRRYLIIYTQGGWERTNHIIVDATTIMKEPHIFGERKEDIFLALKLGTELSVDDINEIISNRSYYLASTNDVDVELKV